MKSFTILLLVVGLLVLHAWAAPVSSSVENQSSNAPATQVPLVGNYLERNCRRRVALTVRDFVTEQLGNVARPVGYLVSSVGVTRWLQSLLLVPAKIPDNAILISQQAPQLAAMIAKLGNGNVAAGLSDLVQKIGANTTPNTYYDAFLALGGDEAQRSVKICMDRGLSAVTPLQSQACASYSVTGMSGLKMLAIRLFTDAMRSSPIGKFAIRFGGLHGLAQQDKTFLNQLASAVAHTRLGVLMARTGGLIPMLEAVEQGGQGLESIAWSIFGPKLWEKVANCDAAKGTVTTVIGGAEYLTTLPAEALEKWRVLSPLSRNRILLNDFPAAPHYSFQFWIMPTAPLPEHAAILHHGAADNERSPAIWTCKNGGLHVRQDTVRGPNGGIDCSDPLPLNVCTLVTVVNRNGEIRLYFNDRLVQKVINPASKPVAGPVYLSSPWYEPAPASVVPVCAITRSLTKGEIIRTVARSASVCPSGKFPEAVRFSAIAAKERAALAFGDSAGAAASTAASSSSSVAEATMIEAQSGEKQASKDAVSMDASINAAQKDVCLFRLRSLSARKLASALRKSTISAEFSQYGNSLRGLINACAAGTLDAAELDMRLRPTRIGVALARVGGIEALVAALKNYLASQPALDPSNEALMRERNQAAWTRVQQVVFTMGGGKVEHALERCANYQHLVVHTDIAAEGCEIINRWGRAALPSFGYKLFDRAMRKSRVGHLYRHYGGLNGLALMLRNYPALEAQVNALIADTELGTMLAAHGGLSALVHSGIQSGSAARDKVWEIMSATVYSSVAQCPEPSLEDMKRNRCRQRVVRRAVTDFYRKLENSALKVYMNAQATVLVTSNGLTVGLEGLARLPAKRVRAIAEDLENTTVGRLLKPHGGLSALLDVARGTRQDMMQFVWNMGKVELAQAVSRCANRSDREMSFIQQCRDKLRKVYLARFNQEVQQSPLHKFVVQFGGWKGLSRHNLGLLNRLAVLVEHHPIAARLRRGGGLLVLLNTAKHDTHAFEAAVTDLYGEAAQSALDHCENQAEGGSVSATANFMVRLKTKLTDPAFKRILDRAMLAAHRPFVQSMIGQELVKVGGMNGLVLASSDANDADLAAYISDRLRIPYTQSALYSVIRELGGAAGIRRKAQLGELVDATAKLQCQVINSTWLKRIFEELGGCARAVAAAGQPEIDDLAQHYLGKPFTETGLDSLLGERRGLAEAVLKGGQSLETAISNAIVTIFSHEHGEQYVPQFTDMVTKILDKIKLKASSLNKSLIDVTNSATKDATQIAREATLSAIQTSSSMKTNPAQTAAPLNATQMALQAIQPHPQVKEPLWDLPVKIIQDMPAKCPNQCSNRGRCIQNTGKVISAPSGQMLLNPWECICDPGWTGTGCEIEIDQYIRFLLSKGRYAPPKCCPVCASQAKPLPNANWVVPSSMGYPMDKDCSSLESISSERRRMECVRQALTTRHRYVPPAREVSKTHPSALFDDPPAKPQVPNRTIPLVDMSQHNALAMPAATPAPAAAPVPPAPALAAAPTYFVEVSTEVSASAGVLTPTDQIHRMFPKQSYSTPDLAAVEDAFDRSMGSAALDATRARQSLAETGAKAQVRSPVTGRLLPDGVLPGSAADTHPEESVAVKRARAEAALSREFTQVYDTPRSLLELTAKGPAPAKPVSNITTVPFFTPEPLDGILVQECCVPCDQYPIDETLAPKFPLAPKAESSIIETMAKNRGPALVKNPNDHTIAKAMQDPLYIRRGKGVRSGTWSHLTRQKGYIRKSAKRLLPSEELNKGKKDTAGCCSYCPYKRVPVIQPIKPNSTATVNVTKALFLEQDANLMDHLDHSLYSFLEESLSVVVQTGAKTQYDPIHDPLLEMVAAEPNLKDGISELMGSRHQSVPARSLPAFPEMEAMDSSSSSSEAEGVNSNSNHAVDAESMRFAASTSDADLNAMLREHLGEEAEGMPVSDAAVEEAAAAIAHAEAQHKHVDAALSEVSSQADTQTESETEASLEAQADALAAEATEIEEAQDAGMTEEQYLMFKQLEAMSQQITTQEEGEEFAAAFAEVARHMNMDPTSLLETEAEEEASLDTFRRRRGGGGRRAGGFGRRGGGGRKGGMMRMRKGGRGFKGLKGGKGGRKGGLFGKGRKGGLFGKGRKGGLFGKGGRGGMLGKLGRRLRGLGGKMKAKFKSLAAKAKVFAAKMKAKMAGMAKKAGAALKGAMKGGAGKPGGLGAAFAKMKAKMANIAKIAQLQSKAAALKPLSPAKAKKLAAAAAAPLPPSQSAFKSPPAAPGMPADVSTVPGKVLGVKEGIQRMLGDWWLDVQRRKEQTFPKELNTTGFDFSTGVDQNVPFLPRVSRRQLTKCCNICPSVFTLRQTPHTPWDDKGPAFDVNK